MTPTVHLSRSDFDQFGSPEHQDWRKHLLPIPSKEVWRGCLGPALLPTHPASSVSRFDHLPVPDRHDRWGSLVDILWPVPSAPPV